MFSGYYEHKRVLVTGHSGFKGGWLSLWLNQLGAAVWGVGLQAPTKPNIYEVVSPQVFAGEITCDIRHFEPLSKALQRIKPDVIFHLAAQSLVRQSYVEPLDTFQTNALGVANLLEAVRQTGLPCPIVIVTSDKCYENREREYAYTENDPLGGRDVYSMSKAAAELVVQAWNRSFFESNPGLGPVATARGGNVIGGGDYAADRIVPDCIRALASQHPIVVRNPGAIRPWQHVLECLSGYLWLAAELGRAGKASPLAGAFNFGPGPAAQQPVRKLVEQVLSHWPGEWTDGSSTDSPHEATRLALSIQKSGELLQWFPTWDFDEAVNRAVEWYHQRHALKNPDMFAISRAQIDAYVEAARRKKLAWTR
jgi:CDP-glucose 4,6-dehydratase